LVHTLLSPDGASFSYTISALESWSFSGIPVDVDFGLGPFPSYLCNDGCTILNHPPGAASLPEVGSVATNWDLDSNGHFFATSTLIGYGFAHAESNIGDMRVTALQPGWSTVTFTYQLQEIGIVPVGAGSLTASASVYASSLGYGLNFSQQIPTIVPAGQSLSIARTITGTWIGSAFFDSIGSGTSISLGVFTMYSTFPSQAHSGSCLLDS
jgi:hypothetical protein